jgi:hypothetical protein
VDRDFVCMIRCVCSRRTNFLRHATRALRTWRHPDREFTRRSHASASPTAGPGGPQILTLRSRRLLPTTVTELKAMARAARMGWSWRNIIGTEVSG